MVVPSCYRVTAKGAGHSPGAGKNGPGKNGPGKNGPGKNGPEKTVR